MKLRTLCITLASLGLAALAGCDPKPQPPKAQAQAQAGSATQVVAHVLH